MKKTKKTKEVKFRHKLITTIARPFLWLLFKLRYKYSYKKYRDLKGKGPFLILANHTVAPDPILMGLSFPFPLYYMATEQIFNMGFLSKLLKYAVNPIKKSKSMNDINAIRKARRIVKEGGSIAIYPEGNLTYTGETLNFNNSIVKLIQFLKIPVIFFVTEGLYLSNPRWALYNKKGKSKGYIKLIIEPEDYLNLSDEELFSLVSDNLYINAYNKQDDLKYKGKNLAAGLERLVFMDLKKDLPFVTYSKNNMLLSTESDFSLKYLETGYVVDRKNKKYTLIEINEALIKSYYNYYKSNDVNLNINVLAQKTTTKSRTSFKNSGLYLNKDGLEITFKTKEILNISFRDIQALDIQGKKRIIVTTSENTWLFKLPLNISPYAFLLTYQFYQKGDKLYEDDFNVSKFGL